MVGRRSFHLWQSLFLGANCWFWGDCIYIYMHMYMYIYIQYLYIYIFTVYVYIYIQYMYIYSVYIIFIEIVTICIIHQLNWDPLSVSRNLEAFSQIRHQAPVAKQPATNSADGHLGDQLSSQNFKIPPTGPLEDGPRMFHPQFMIRNVFRIVGVWEV